MAGLIVLEPISPTKERNFKQFMAGTGHYDDSGMQYPRLQILTVSEIKGIKQWDNTSLVQSPIRLVT